MQKKAFQQHAFNNEKSVWPLLNTHLNRNIYTCIIYIHLTLPSDNIVSHTHMYTCICTLIVSHSEHSLCYEVQCLPASLVLADTSDKEGSNPTLVLALIVNR